MFTLKFAGIDMRSSSSVNRYLPIPHALAGNEICNILNMFDNKNRQSFPCA
jgi:hypothetical protein